MPIRCFYSDTTTAERNVERFAITAGHPVPFYKRRERVATVIRHCRSAMDFFNIFFAGPDDLLSLDFRIDFFLLFQD